MKTVRVWFNHWFSTAYHIIRMIGEDEDINFAMVGSNTDENCVYRAVCDEWFTEAKFGDSDEYVDFCVAFCRARKIDVFAPRRGIRAVSRRIGEFDAIGVKVLAERNHRMMSALSDKAETYRLFGDAGIGHIPPYRVVTSAAEYEEAYHRFKTESNRVCLKFASDEGAVSFRVVDDRIEHNLTENAGTKVAHANVVEALSRLGKFPELLVMPYLSGAEISVDCLSARDGEHIIIPRRKSWRRSETIKFDHDIVNICEAFLDKFGLRCPCNLQFKYEGGVPYLLEVNARMSGGIQLSYAATGINIPNIAVNRLLGVEKRPVWDKTTRVVSFIETPVLLR
ncbi:MAG: ATP-grasp domain-containing protein [Synergistaceae bacterium]|jgi:biotin carboxylase|nr:ATP-grasp domain-containing protein [Synergistaceae bacterium]